MSYLLYILAGLCAGLLSGLFGIGGGIVIVPVLIIIFKHLHIFSDIIMPVATATSLASIIFTSASAAFAYNKQRLIVWPIFWNFIPGLSIGIFFGIIMVQYITSYMLIKGFAVFLIMVAIYLYFKRDEIKEMGYQQSNSLLKKILLVMLAICVGILSVSFGIGGGLLIVPSFLFIGLTMRQASATSAICGVPIAILGTISFMIAGLGKYESPSLLGFVYWPAALIITSVSIFSAPVGVRIAENFRPDYLRRLFSFILICTAIHLW